MKNKIFSVFVGLLAAFLVACNDDDDALTISSVHVNGGPLEESITPTSARVRIRLNETAGIGEVGICYGVQSDRSALLTYGDVLTVETIDTVMYLDLTNLESATTYSYIAYAKFQDASTPESYSVVRSFTTQSADLFLTPSRLNRSAAGSVDTVKVATTFDSWELAAYDYDWLTCEKKDSLLILTTEDNLGTEVRSAILKIQAGSRTQSLAVTQAVAAIHLSLDTVEVSSRGASGSFIVHADLEWSAITENDWLECAVEQDSIVRFTADVNDLEEERYGYITVAISDQLYEVFTIVQRSSALYVTKTELSYDLRGGVDGFKVECYADDWTFSSDEKWCQVVRVGTDSLTVIVEPNDTDMDVRTATITLAKDQVTKIITVSQESGLTVTDLGLDGLLFWGGEGDILVKAYTDAWEVKSLTDDFIATRVNDSIVTVEVAAMNTTDQDITGSVTITAGNLSQTIDLLQPHAVIAWNMKNVEFSSTGSMISNTSTNSIYMKKYKVVGDASWLTISSGDITFVPGEDGYMVVENPDDAFTTLSLTAEPNQTGETRSVTIIGVWEGVSESFTVTQEGN